MLISNEDIRTYYFKSSRTGNHPTLGSREKLPPAIGTTRPNHSNGSRLNLQPRHSLPSGDFPSYGSTLAAAFFVLPLCRVGKGCAPSWSCPQNFKCENQSGGRSHSRDHASPCDALEYANHGKSSVLKRSDHTSDMEATQPETTSGQNLQTQPRQALCRKVVRHRWIVSESSGQIAGSLRGRKESNPGSGQNSAGSAAKERPVRNDDSRLQTQRHDHLVCGLKYAGRQSYRRLHAASSTPGVYPFPQANRWRNPLRTGSSFDCRQLRYPQTSASEVLAQTASPVPSTLYTNFQFLVKSGRTLVSRDHRQTDTTRFFSKRLSLDQSHQRLPGKSQPKSKDFRLERSGGAHFGKDRQM